MACPFTTKEGGKIMKLNETREIKRNIERVKTPKEIEEEEWAERLRFIQTTSFEALMAQNKEENQK